MRRKKQVLTCFWRNISKGTIVISNPARQIRSTDATTIYLPKPKTELLKKSVFHYGSTLWNALPVNVSLCDHIDSFKLEINKIFVN